MYNETKFCSRCEIEKEISEFHKDKSKKDGLNPACKICIKDWRTNNKDYLNKYALQYRLENKENIAKYQQIWYEKNKENWKEYQKEYNKQYYFEKYHNDILFQIKESLRTRIRQAIKNNSKSKRTLELLGCTIEQLKQHLESQFTKGMSWDSCGYYMWHIDHIKPCASFDLSNPEEQLKCFNFKNLQPLWAVDNLRKSAKF